MSAIRLLPWAVHEGVEYLAGLFFLLAPFIFGFRDEGEAFAYFVAIGLVFILSAMLTRGGIGVAAVMPVMLHNVLDFVLAIFLIVAPFVFLEDALQQNVSMIAGIALLVMSLVTRYPRRLAPEGEEVSLPDSQHSSA